MTCLCIPLRTTPSIDITFGLLNCATMAASLRKSSRSLLLAPS